MKVEDCGESGRLGKRWRTEMKVEAMGEIGRLG